MRWGCIIFLWLIIKIKGKENLLNQPCVYICKHQSSWETLIFHGLLYKICFILKDDLLKIPLLGYGLKMVGSIAINRKKNLSSFKKILKIGKQRIDDGLSIAIFPEGKRVDVKTYPKFHKTAITLSKLVNVNFIPIAHNSGCYWPNKLGLIKPGIINVSIGKPINSSHMNIDEGTNYCYTWINNEIKKYGG